MTRASFSCFKIAAREREQQQLVVQEKLQTVQRTGQVLQGVASLLGASKDVKQGINFATTAVSAFIKGGYFGLAISVFNFAGSLFKGGGQDVAALRHEQLMKALVSLMLVHPRHFKDF